MSTALQRGLVLFEQGRYDLADREIRRVIAEDPDNPTAHSFLALCLMQRDRDAESLAEADEGVRLGPDLAYSHYIRARSLQAVGRLGDSEAAVREAIRIDPADADHFGLLASIQMGRRRWPEALLAAEKGLSLDPEHPGCTNLRAMALVQLGRKDEAATALGSALANDPENALTHANQGWTYLHQGDQARALEHFREALRIDPELEWARVGIVEALKARFLIYRLMLRFFLWMGRQSGRAQWAVILGFIFGRKVLADLAEANPRLQPFIYPILALSFAFLMLTWIASPLFNLALRFNRFGRMALSRQQRVESNWIGGCFVLAASSFAASLATGSPLATVSAAYFGLLLLPLTMTFHQPAGKPRWMAAAYTAALAAIGPLVLVHLLMGPEGPLAALVTPLQLVQLFFFGAILSTWVPTMSRGLATGR